MAKRGAARALALVLIWTGVCFASCFGAAEQLTASSSQNVSKSGLALQGYDPVSYFGSEGPDKGLERLVAEFEGARYLFASEGNRRAFLASPETYRPAFGGWCAWAMLKGDKVEVDPESFRIFEGRLLLFYDGFWGNTKAKWVKKAEAEPEAELFETASEHWSKLSLDE